MRSSLGVFCRSTNPEGSKGAEQDSKSRYGSDNSVSLTIQFAVETGVASPLGPMPCQNGPGVCYCVASLSVNFLLVHGRHA